MHGNEYLGCCLCAMVGTGLVVLAVLPLSAVRGGGRAQQAARHT